MRRAGLLLMTILLCPRRTAALPERPETPRPLTGIAGELPSNASEAARTQAAAEVRGAGASLFALTVSWSEAEPTPGRYRVDDVLRAARLLRQSGATVHLDLPLIALRARDVPSDLAGVPFDDSRLSTRLGRLLDALEPALLDASTLSLGYAAESYFTDKPAELKAFRLLFQGAVEFLGKKVPHLKVGVTTAAPTESPAPAVAAELHQKSPVLFYLYAPFVRENPYVHRPPDAIDRDWKMLLESAAGRPIAFPEVSYSSASENGSSLEAQADFVRHLKRLIASTDGRLLLFARYANLRDAPRPRTAVAGGAKTPTPAPAPEAPLPLAVRRAAFLEHRGLQTESGQPKPAWREWARTAR